MLLFKKILVESVLKNLKKILSLSSNEENVKSLYNYYKASCQILFGFGNIRNIFAKDSLFQNTLLLTK